MTKIYLIRSAEAEGELYHFAQGLYESNLTDRGWRQVKALETRFSDIPVDAVYTSDLYRACATASALYKAKGLPVNRREDLREMCLGAWEGRNWGNIAYEEPRQLRNYKTALHQWYVDGAEMPEQALKRMHHALLQIAAAHEGGSVAVFSHDTVIRLLLAELAGVPLNEVHNTPVVQSTAVAVIEADQGSLRVVSQNDAGHLSDLAYQANEKPRNSPDFNTDTCCYLLRWIEYGELMAEAIQSVWEESGEDRPFNKDLLLEDAAMLSTIVAYVEQTPAGFVQLGVQPGWITLLCTHPECRNFGIGIQLIGQAVLSARDKGEQYLHIVLPKNNPHRQFFLEYGFTAVGQTPEGREILEKDLTFDPEFFSE